MRQHNNLLSKSTRQFIYQRQEGVGLYVEKVGGGFWLVEGQLSRGGGGALREANIFSGLGQQSKNTLLMLMCIRSEQANISTALQWQSGRAGYCCVCL